MAYILDELRHESNTIPDTFESVDRSIPVPPAPAILHKALAACRSIFLDLTDEARAISDSRDCLLEAICQYADENQRMACASSMSEFETRLIEIRPQIAPAEINQCYAHLSRLLSSKANDQSLPWQSRLLATAHFLEHCAKPETLSQGTKIGSQIFCLAQKLATTKPGRLAEMISSAAIDGTWKAFDGKVVVLDEHTLKPGPEEILYFPGENKRSYAAKIIQCLMLNNCLRRRPKPLYYGETPGRPGRDYSGQIVRTREGEAVNPRQGASISFLELALLARFEFGEKSCVIVNDLSFANNTAEFADKVSNQNYLVHISSASDLLDALSQARENDMLPVTVAVDERRLLADCYQDGINQAINVVLFNEYGMLQIYNPQLLPGMPRVARINLQRLYNATHSPFRA